MISRAATIEPAGQAEGREAVEKRGNAMKFLYASGSRPLEGYTIKRGIGRGGFGEVYFATSEAGKELALKHVERNLEVELRGVGQCLNLKHPNLIDLYDIRYDEQGDAWVVMEYVAGSSLKDVIDRNPNGLPLDQVEFWFRGIAAGTAYLHEHGIVHRDLKPGNIFEDSGFVKIGDYGLSKFISTSRKSAQTESVGTFHYMAPEIGKGVYGKEIDIYALGIVLYEMLTGSVPFDGESSQEIIMKHLTADPDLSAVPQPYRSIIQRALQKDPQKRFTSVGEMVASLAGTKPGPGGSPPLSGPSFLAAANGQPVEPLYIGDDDEGIELGPLELHPENAPVTAELVKANGRHIAQPASRIVAHQASPGSGEEPIAKALKDGWTKFRHWWNHGRATTPIKILLLVVVAVAAIANGGWLVPVAAVLGAVYLTYLGIRMLAQLAKRPAGSPFADGHDQPLPHNVAWHLTWEQHGRQMLCEKTAGDRIGELTGSMLAAALIAGVLTVVMTAIGGETMDNSTNALAGPAWLWLATTAGSWLVLGAGKLCERTSGEQIKRRFAMLVLGLVFATVAWGSSEYLMVKLHDGFAARSIAGSGFARSMYGPDGAPQLTAYLAYFGAIFLMIGWWKQVDPLRSSRLRIAPILLAILAAWVVQPLLPFPQPWGFMIVAAVSITTQLSAPWLSPAERTAAANRRGVATV
jgi:serine/threonine protein kinase/threonine/homoserine/homoserine lactone efflux protein